METIPDNVEDNKTMGEEDAETADAIATLALTNVRKAHNKDRWYFVL